MFKEFFCIEKKYSMLVNLGQVTFINEYEKGVSRICLTDISLLVKVPYDELKTLLEKEVPDGKTRIEIRSNKKSNASAKLVGPAK